MSIRTLFFKAKMQRGKNALSLFVFSSLFAFGFFVGSPEVKAQPWGGSGWCPTTGCEGSMNVSGPFGACPGNLVTCPVSGQGCMMGQSGNCCSQSTAQEPGLYSYVCESSGGGGGGGGGGTTFNPAPSFSYTCNAAGTQARLSFGGTTYNSTYALRIDANPTSWTNTCSRINPGDVCSDVNASQSPYLLNTVPGANYAAWIHTYDISTPGAASSITVNCPPPPPPAPELAFTADSYSLPANGSTTLRWFSRNATSCTASRSPVGGTWTGAKGFTTNQPYSESTGALLGGQVYTYRLTCTGAPGTSPATLSFDISVAAPPLPPIANPISSATCSPAGNSVTISWNAVPTSVIYPLRVNDTIDPWGPGPGQGCAFSTSPNDTCLDSIASLSYTRPVVPGHTYQAWMHACRPGQCSPELGTTPFPFRCDAPAPTATVSLDPAAINIHPTAGSSTVRVRWSSTNATSCAATSGTGFATGGATSSPGVIVPTPGSVGSYPYSIRCTGPGGSKDASASLNVVSVCNPTTTCTASDICEGESCNNGCTTVVGTKDCRKFWKEVAP